MIIMNKGLLIHSLKKALTAKAKYLEDTGLFEVKELILEPYCKCSLILKKTNYQLNIYTFPFTPKPHIQKFWTLHNKKVFFRDILDNENVERSVRAKICFYIDDLTDGDEYP